MGDPGLSFLNKEPAPLRFGTSGLRGLVEDMTDLECYINVKGYVEYLKSIGIEKGGIEEGDILDIAGDLRSSTRRIIATVARAIEDSGSIANNCGEIPTPALAYYAMQNHRASIMVTGSHIPDEPPRNGIKPYKTNGEVLKSDEDGIFECVARVRREEYAKLGTAESLFTHDALFKTKKALPEIDEQAEDLYIHRYLDVFPQNCLKDQTLVVYEHSAVGRDVLVKILEGLGANVIRVGRSDNTFIPVDTEAIRKEDERRIKQWAKEYMPFAVLSTDGDSDRPWLSDENGEFLRGDKLGILAAKYLRADFAAVPISSNDAVDRFLKDELQLKKARIGSPYVIKEMLDAVSEGFNRVVSWEVNGGFLTQTELTIDNDNKTLKALPTRDAVLPLLCTMLLAIKEGRTISSLIDTLPKRFTQAGKKEFSMAMDQYLDISSQIIKEFSFEDVNIDKVNFGEKITIFYKDMSKKEIDRSGPLGEVLLRKKDGLENDLPQEFDEIAAMIFTDGVRIILTNDDIIHFRPSGNAPEFRCYSNANSQERADRIVEIGMDHILPDIIKKIAMQKR